MADKKATVAIARDYWDENEVRHRAGTEIIVPIEDALRGVASGAMVLVSIEEDEPKKRGRPPKAAEAVDTEEDGA